MSFAKGRSSTELRSINCDGVDRLVGRDSNVEDLMGMLCLRARFNPILFNFCILKSRRFMISWVMWLSVHTVSSCSSSTEQQISLKPYFNILTINLKATHSNRDSLVNHINVQFKHIKRVNPKEQFNLNKLIFK